MSDTVAVDKLPMVEFLREVDRAYLDGCDRLIGRGYHPNVVYAKAEKAARKGYYEYGVSIRFGWLTPEGRRYLADHSDGGEGA